MKKFLKTPQSLILCGFPGKKNYVKYAFGWKNYKKMIKYDMMNKQKIISKQTENQSCFYTIRVTVRGLTVTDLYLIIEGDLT